ncbi:MAG: hypothetical protein H7A01_12505 [Hahellaceae bacterium]|nr:hypothetical protein [Hahellaceae bacterium]MCP5209861.1 hypothetical protein [Hahellaceae bacterium]
MFTHHIYLLFFLALSLGVNAENLDWEQVNSMDNISVFVASDKKTGFKVCKVETLTTASVDALVALNTDYKNLVNWMDTAVDISQISTKSRSDYINYFKWASPWPVKDRDSVTRSVLTKRTDGSVLLKFDSIENIVEESGDYERMNLIDGLWEFVPNENGSTKVVYQIMVDPGGNVPIWLVNMKVTEIPLRTVQKMHEQLKSENYRNAKIDWL